MEYSVVVGQGKASGKREKERRSREGAAPKKDAGRDD